MKKIIMVFSIAYLLFGSAIAQNYSLEEYVQLVKENNKDIMIAAKDREIAETQSTEATANAYPQLNAEATYNRNLKDIYMYLTDMPAGSGFPNKFKVNRNNEFGLQAVLSQTLFNYTVFNAIKAAEQYENLTDYTYDATQQAVIAGAKKAYYQTLLLGKVYEVRKASEENSKDNYVRTKNAFESGLASKLELLQAEVRWKNTIPETLESKRNYELSLSTLKNIAGINAKEKIKLTDNFKSLPAKPDYMELRAALENRPDYNAMVWEKNLRTTNIDVEMSTFYPSLYASLVYNYSAQSDEYKFEDENHALIAGLTLKIPIFSGFQRTARVQKAKIEVEQSDLRIKKFTEKISNELNEINIRLNEAIQKINASNATLEVAQKGYEIAQKSAENGLATQLELKDARLLYDHANINKYAAIFDYLLAYFDWEHATGNIN